MQNAGNMANELTKNRKMRILLVAERRDEFYQWFSSILSKEFTVEEFYMHSSVFNPPFFLKRLFLVIKNWKRLIRKFNPDKVIVYGKALTSIWIFVLLIRLFGLKIEIIIFRYDLEHFRPYLKGLKTKAGHFITRKLEKFCLLQADKIIHKGLANELQFLAVYDKIKNKPHYLFREFINPDLIQPCNPNMKLSKKDGNFHLVIVGALPLVEVTYSESMWEFYPKITNQKIHLYIYTNVDKSTGNKLKKIESENLFFHYCGYLSRDKLLKEISKYDYGVYLTSWNRGNIKNNHFTITSMSYRIFDYISSHLPIISSNDSTAAVDLIDKYKIGIHIPFNKVYSLKQILMENKKNYLKTVKNIDNAIKHFSDQKNLINFIRM